MVYNCKRINSELYREFNVFLSRKQGETMKSSVFKLIMLTTFSSLIFSACTPSIPLTTTKSNTQRQLNPAAAEGDVRTLVDGNNAFALDLYHSLHSHEGNLILSPYSISLALTMTYAGARNLTESQMADTLHFNLPQDRLHPAFNALDLELSQKGNTQTSKDQSLQLNIANAIWAEKTYPFKQEFLDTLALNYGAGINLADFIHQFDSVRIEINNWVGDQTNNKIKDLLPNGVLNTDSRMVLVNAIYFKADWEAPFDPASTADAPFHLLDGSQVQVRMMFDERPDQRYAKGEGYQVVRLPYKGGTAAMDIIVPDEGSFDQFESTLDATKLNTVLSGMESRMVRLGLPKFEYSSSFGLPDQLKALGMTDAFDGDKADFSGMTGNRDLYISDVIHKAFVAVDEKGTEAAAATAVIMQTAGAIQPDVSLTIDRPFIFIIEDSASGQILFMGRVLNPSP
jgi:serpin B